MNDGIQLGALATTGDARYYRWILAGATALAPGKMQQAAAEVTANENLAVAAAAIGATSVTTTTTVTVTANQYTGGYVVVTTTPGQGYMYQIATHPAATAAVLTLNLVDPITVALTTSSVIDLIANPYTSVILCPATATGLPVGAAVAAIPAAGYGWVQTRGVASVLANGAVAVGVSVCTSAAVAGAVKTNVAAGPYVGNSVTGVADTEYGGINLNLS